MKAALFLLACLSSSWVVAQGLVLPQPSENPRSSALPDSGADYRQALHHFAIGDKQRGLVLLRKAAEAGHVEAQFSLGNFANLYLRDYSQAAMWWRKAAAQGHVGAMFSLGALSQTDRVESRSSENASAHEQQASAQGLALAPKPEAAEDLVANAAGTDSATPSADSEDIHASVISTTVDSDDSTQVWLSSPDVSATIQIFASVSLDEVMSVAQRHAFRRPLALLSFSRDGRNWHALLYGQFPDAAAAQRAMPELPASLLGGKPWVRRMGNVRAQTQMNLQALPGKP